MGKVWNRRSSTGSSLTAVNPSDSPPLADPQRKAQSDDSPPLSDTKKDGSDPQGKEEATIKEKEALTDSEAGSLKSIERGQLAWPQVAALLFGEYIVIAILSFPQSYSVLGMAGGLITTLIIGLATLWTSHWLWRYCLHNPTLLDITSIGRALFGNSRIAYELSMIGLVLNNIFIMGLHTLTGAIALNTLSDHATCTIVFTVVFVVVMFAASLTRELKRVAVYSMVAASTMLVALILCMAFAGAESQPAGFDGTPPSIRAWAAPGTTFVAGMNAALNITYTYVGQALVPSYVQDMKNPRDFPKALYVCTAAEIILFSLGGSIIYWGVGSEYVTSPAYGALRPVFAKVVAGFTLPTLLVVGVLYAVVTGRIIFFRVFGEDSIHVTRVTKKGTAVWVCIIASVWIAAFVLAESIPFFDLLLSVMASAFDAWFGFVFWGVAFFRLYPRQERFASVWRSIETVFAAIVIVVGLFIFGAGLYTSAQAIADEYAAGTVGGVFSCANNGF